MKTTQEEPSRLVSLDVLRGFDMLMIMGGGAAIVAVLKACGCGADSALVRQFTHVDWHGLRFEDTIFALFLFIAGVTFPFSCAKRQASGAGALRLVGGILKRGGLLVLLGFVYNGILATFDFSTLVWGSVLGRIGVAWTLAALVYVFCGPRVRAGVAAGVLLGYWILTLAVHAPDFPGADVLTPQGNFACYVDRMLMPGRLTVAGLYTNQGLLGCVSAAVTALLGMFAGDLLRATRWTGGRKTLILLGSAALLAGAGLVMAKGCGAWSFPINKKLWSSSFVLVVGGYSAAMLALFYWVVDVCGYVRGTLLFRAIGLNSITAYLLWRFVSFGDLARKLFGGVAKLVPSSWSGVVVAVGAVALAGGLLVFLHRRRIYFKVG